MSARNSAAFAAVMPSEREIVFTRVFDAPRELVWKAWTDPQQVSRWWGPNGFTATTELMDVRPGGTWKHTMHGPDGKDYPNEKIYREVVRPERLVYSHGGGREGERRVDFETTVTFEALGNKTKLTMRMLFPSVEARDQVIKNHGAVEGGNQTLSRLEEFLPKPASEAAPSREELVLTREFNAPRGLVWNAWTDPKHLAQWWGPHGFTNPVCEVDLRKGGSMLIHMRAPDGTVYPMKAVFEEIVPPERLIFLSGAMDEKGTLLFEVLTTVNFVEHAGKTKLTVKARVLSATSAAAPHLAGMQAGWAQTLERLEAFVTKK